jgi:hypothetical protein
MTVIDVVVVVAAGAAFRELVELAFVIGKAFRRELED